MPKPGKRGLLLLALTLLLIIGLLFALPHGLRLAAEHWLAEQGMQAEIEDVDFNLFTGTAAIRNASARNNAGRGFELRQIEIAWYYTPLFEKRVHLKRLNLDGLQVDVAQRQNETQRLEIAGLALQGNANDSGSDWGFGLDQLVIDETTVTYTDAQLRQSITLKASSVSDIATWADSQPIVISSQAAIAGGGLRLQGQINPFGDRLKATLRLQAQALPLATAAPLLPAEALRADGLLHADLALLADYSAASGLDLSITGDSRLRQYQLGISQPALDIGGDITQWQGKIQVLKTPDSGPQISGHGNLAASQLRITDRNTLIDLGQLTSIDISGIQISSLEAIRASAIRLGKGFALKQAGASSEDALPALQWGELRIVEPALEKAAVSIDTVELQGVSADLTRDAEGQWNIQQMLTQSFPPPENTSNNSNASAPLRVNHLTLVDSRARIQDATIKPAMDVQLSAIQASLQALDNQQSAQDSPLQLQASVGDYGKLDLQGVVRPFAAPADARIKGKITGIDTVPLSGFARRLVGHRIRQGTVSGDLDINIEQGRLDSSLDLVLNKLQVAAVKGEAGAFEKNAGMPLGTALGLLRDRDENIRLKLPIKGDLDKPDININDIIRKATFKAIQTAALTFYSPLGIVSVGDKLLQLATALRFDPVVFAPGQTTLDASATAHLATLTDSLTQRPALQITLCGFAVPADRKVLAEEIANANTRLFGLIRPDADPDAVPEERLLELARKRMRTVGDYLGQYGIATERLILCDGEISDDSKARPRVSLRL